MRHDHPPVVQLGAVTRLAPPCGEVHLASAALAPMGLSLAPLAAAALGLESGAKSLGQIASPVLGGVVFGASVAVPFWLASRRLLGLAPVFAWSARRTHEPPSGRAARATLASGGQEAR